MEWLPVLLALVSPLYTSAAYTFARGTHQPPPFGSARGCTDLEELLTDPRDYADAIDLCFDDQFSCPHAKPFVGEAMIKASSGGNPAIVQIKDSNDWLPALEPVHPSRGPRRTTKDFVPVIGCMVNNHRFNEPRFVLSAADVRCRPSTDAATFPAECNGGASQRNVMIESTEAAISFVERTTRQSARRELGLFDTESDHAKGKRTALMLVLSPKDFTNPVDAWTSDNNKSDPTSTVRDGNTGHWLDPTFLGPRQCVETAVCASPHTRHTCVVPLLRCCASVLPCTGLPLPARPPPCSDCKFTPACACSQMTEVAAEMKAWSWGSFELDWSVAGPLTADYTQLQPDDRTGYPATWSGDAPVGWSAAHRKTGVQTGYPCSNYPCSCNEALGYLDVLGAHAAAAQGVDIGSYDYVAYWLPGCPRYVNEGGESVRKGWHANQASVGSGSLLMVACWKGAEQTLGHEFGHSCEQPHIVSSDAPMSLCLCSTSVPFWAPQRHLC